MELRELRAVRYEVADGVATVTLHRPDRLNAWTGRMHTEYRWCLAQAEADPAVRVVVVTGAGRGFCAGADFRALASEVSPASVREAKRQLFADLHGDVGTAVERSVELLDRMMGEPDNAEGVRAFVEKRPPRFPDR